MSLVYDVTTGRYTMRCNHCRLGCNVEVNRASRVRFERTAQNLGWDTRRSLCPACKKRKKTSVKKHFDKPPLLAGQVEG